MNSREKILQAVLSNQPQKTELPDISAFRGDKENLSQQFIDVFTSIGGSACIMKDLNEVKKILRQEVDLSKRIVTTIDELHDIAEPVPDDVDPHSFENVELAIIRAHFVVAENGASWFTEEMMGQRILPYICQHLAVIVYENDIVPKLHEAYEKIGSADYGFGGFIGGPSKTADIEQALVLGAHGPLSMKIFIIQQE
jgi:L-lactate dehydrogenase complex protein LldG